jgi:hypothetical protein
VNIEQAIKRINEIDVIQNKRDPEKTCFVNGCENCDDGNVKLCEEWVMLNDFLSEECIKLERMKTDIKNGLYGNCEKLIKQIDEKIELVKAKQPKIKKVR